MDHFDAEQLIQAVEARPAIWDKRNPDYGDRAKRKLAWEEIVNMVAEESTPDSEKKQIGDALIKKWKHLRDRYSRKAGRSLKPGRGAGKETPYIHSRQMSFLKDVIDQRKTHSSSRVLAADDEDDVWRRGESSPTSERSSTSVGNPSKNIPKKSRMEPAESRILSSLEVCQPKVIDDDEHFLLSLLPIMRTIPPEYKIASRMEVMQVLSTYVRQDPGAVDAPQNSSHGSSSSVQRPSQNIYQPPVHTSAHQNSSAQLQRPIYTLLQVAPHLGRSSRSPRYQQTPARFSEFSSTTSEESSVEEDSKLSLF